MYLESNLNEVPSVGMRSVGLLVVTVSERHGIERAIEVATERGRMLGCWILIEHAAFGTLKQRASRYGEAVMLLAHGSVAGVHHVRVRGKLTTEFDCVMQTDNELTTAQA